MIGLNARNPERFRAIANQEGKPVKIRYGPATVIPFLSCIEHCAFCSLKGIQYRTSHIEIDNAHALIRVFRVLRHG